MSDFTKQIPRWSVLICKTRNWRATREKTVIDRIRGSKESLVVIRHLYLFCRNWFSYNKCFSRDRQDLSPYMSEYLYISINIVSSKIYRSSLIPMTLPEPSCNKSAFNINSSFPLKVLKKVVSVQESA